MVKIMSKDNLGDRMKTYYENRYRFYLTRRTPCIIRIDGNSFHSFTRGFAKPYDMVLKQSMWETAEYLCSHIMGAKFAYVQSDEISILVLDYSSKLTTEAWFDYNIQKMVSVSAAMATLKFLDYMRDFYTMLTERLEKYNNIPDCNVESKILTVDQALDKADKILRKLNGGAFFDARAFSIPKEEVNNYFVWRQQDATKNSVMTLAQQYYSQSALNGVKYKEAEDMLFTEKGINWNDLPTVVKRGSCSVKPLGVEDARGFKIDTEIPIFTQDREYVNQRIVFE
jgi:tRNA(His) 5'-end guanylyltransferase